MTRTPAEIAAEAMEAFAHDGPLCDDYNLALAQVALSALEREGFVVARAVELETPRANLREAWSALALIREAVETLGPVGAMQAREHQSSPTFTDEAEAIVEGVRKMAGLNPRKPHHREAFWTCEESEVGNLYYFGPTERARPPYLKQRHVKAIIDIASDGTLAGVELIDDMPPPPARPQDGGGSVSVHPIPKEALDDRLAFVGTAGSGKTYNAGSGVERLLSQKARVVIIDPLGVWWGLRLREDGATPSRFDVAIFGGAHGDLPLTEHAGALIGETAAGMSESCIVDLSQLGTKASERRFMLAFLTALYRKTSGEPLHLIVDEADMFAPQRLMDKEGDAAKLLGMMETIVRRGRVKGFIPWLITQRPAVLSKDVLSQADGLVAFKLTSSQDRAAIGAWIEGQADQQEGKAILASLPGMERGQGVVWHPRLGLLETARFPAKVTFDSSRTPKRGETKRTATLKPLDLGALKDRLSKVEAETKANDPRALQAEIARLKREVAAKPAAEPVADPQAVATADRAGYERGHAEGLAVGLKRAGAALATVQARLNDAVAAVAAGVEQCAVDPATIAVRQAPAPRAPTTVRIMPKPERPAAALATSTDLGGPQKRILAALGFWKSIGHDNPSRPQVAAVAGYTHTSGSFRNTISTLNVAGLISGSNGQLSLTTENYDHLDASEARQKLNSILGGPEKKVVDALMGAGDLLREDVASRAGYEVTSGSFRNTLSTLNVLSIVTKPQPGYVALSSWAQELLA